MSQIQPVSVCQLCYKFKLFQIEQLICSETFLVYKTVFKWNWKEKIQHLVPLALLVILPMGQSIDRLKSLVNPKIFSCNTILAESYP